MRRLWRALLACATFMACVLAALVAVAPQTDMAELNDGAKELRTSEQRRSQGKADKARLPPSGGDSSGRENPSSSAAKDGEADEFQWPEGIAPEYRGTRMGAAIDFFVRHAPGSAYEPGEFGDLPAGSPYDPDAFETLVDRLTDECDLPALVAVDCAEAPCLPIFAVEAGGPPDFGSCAAWLEVFGGSQDGRFTFEIPCGESVRHYDVPVPYGSLDTAMRAGSDRSAVAMRVKFRLASISPAEYCAM